MEQHWSCQQLWQHRGAALWRFLYLKALCCWPITPLSENLPCKINSNNKIPWRIQSPFRWYSQDWVGEIAGDDYSLFLLLLADFIQGKAQDLLPLELHNPDNCFSILFTTDISFLRQENCWNAIEVALTAMWILFLPCWPPRQPGTFHTQLCQPLCSIPCFSWPQASSSAQDCLEMNLSCTLQPHSIQSLSPLQSH